MIKDKKKNCIGAIPNTLLEKNLRYNVCAFCEGTVSKKLAPYSTQRKTKLTK